MGAERAQRSPSLTSRVDNAPLKASRQGSGALNVPLNASDLGDARPGGDECGDNGGSCGAEFWGSHDPPGLERLPSPSHCAGPPHFPPPCPPTPCSLPPPAQVLTLHKLGWGVGVAQPETYYTRLGPGPEDVRPDRQRLCRWWGRGTPSLQERGPETHVRGTAGPTCPPNSAPNT